MRVTNFVSIIRLAILYFSNGAYFDIISPEVYLLMFCLAATLNIFVDLIFGIKATNKRKEWGKQKIEKFTSKAWIYVEIDRIKVGDLVRIRPGFFCPVDVLLLNTTESKAAHQIFPVNEKIIAGSNNLVYKHPIRDFSRDFLLSDEKRSQLSGVVEYSTPNADTEGMLGIFKIKGDPRVTPIKSTNIVFAGTTLYANEIIGFVLYTGTNTKFSQKTGIKELNSLKKVYKSRSSMTSLIDSVSWFFTMLSLYTAFCLLLYYDENSVTARRSQMIWRVSSFGHSSFRDYLQALASICSLVPQFLTILQDVINILVGLRFQHYNRGRPASAVQDKAVTYLLTLQNHARYLTDPSQPDSSPLFTERPLSTGSTDESPMNIRDRHRKSLPSQQGSLKNSVPQKPNISGESIKGQLIGPISCPETRGKAEEKNLAKIETQLVDLITLLKDGRLAHSNLGNAEQVAFNEIRLEFKHATSLAMELERNRYQVGLEMKKPAEPSISSSELEPHKKKGKMTSVLNALEDVFKRANTKQKIVGIPADSKKLTTQGDDLAGQTNIFESSKLKETFNIKDKEKKGLASVFQILPESWSKVLNPSLITSLGNIDHVVFDKTDTLTMSKKEIVYFSTLKKTYNLIQDDEENGEADKKSNEAVSLGQRVEEFQKNPIYKGEGKNEAYYDENEKDQEAYDEFYEEKSQEYNKELQLEYDSKLFEEDSKFDEIRDIVKIPDFMPRKDLSISREDPSSMIGKDDLTEQQSKRKIEFGEHSMIGIMKASDDLRQGSRLQAKGISITNRNFVLEDLVIPDIIPQTRGHLVSGKRNTTNSNMSYRELLMLEEAGESEDQEEIIELQDMMCQVKSQNAFLYDNYTRSEEIEFMFCACGLFLYCGMTELIQQFTPTHINTAIAEFLDAMKVRVWSSDFSSGSCNIESQVASTSLPQLPKHASPEVSVTLPGYRVTVSSDFGMMKHFRVLGYNPRTDGREITSMIVAITGANKDQYYLLVRGDENQLRSLLDFSQHEQTVFRNLMIQYKQLLLSRTIFAWRRLTEAEVTQYSMGYSQIIRSNRSDLAGLYRLTQSLEHRLRLIGCVGFKSQLRDDAAKLVHNLREAEFKISMISGDNYENTLHVAKELKLSESSSGLDPFRVVFETMDRGHFELLNQLESVYHFIKQKNNNAFDYYLRYLLSGSKSKSAEKQDYLEEVEGHLFAGENFDFGRVFQRPMIISGISLKLIQQNPRLAILFRALSVFAHSFIGYGFEPSQKGEIIKLIKNFDQKVLSIGDGVNDLTMFRESDISIQLETASVPFYMGDIIVNRLDIIQKLIFIDGFGLYKSVRLSLMFAVVTVSKFIIANIWIYTTSAYLTRYLSPNYMSVLLLLIIGESVFRVLSQGTYSDYVLSANPFIYQERVALDSQLLIFVACFVLNIFIEMGVLFLVLSLVSHFLFTTGRTVEHEIQIAFVFLMLYFNMAYFSYNLYRYRPAKASLSMLILYHMIMGALLIYHKYQLVAPLASTFELKEVFGDLGVLTSVLFSIIVPSYFNFLITYFILHKLIHPIRFYLIYTLGKYKDWQRKIDPTDLKFLKLVMGRIRRNADRSVINLIAQLSKVCTESAKDLLLDPILSKMMLIDMHTFTSGINQLTNKILDNRMSMKYMKISMKVSSKFTLLVVAFTIASLSINTLSILLQSSNCLEVFRFHDFWKIVTLLVLIGYLRWKKSEPTTSLLNPISILLIVVVLIEIIFIPIDWVSETSHSQYWTPNFFDNRLISSPIPLDFYLTSGLLGVLDISKMLRAVYMRGPIANTVEYWIFSLIILLHMLGFLLIQWSMKKKVGILLTDISLTKQVKSTSCQSPN